MPLTDRYWDCSHATTSDQHCLNCVGCQSTSGVNASRVDLLMYSTTVQCCPSHVSDLVHTTAASSHQQGLRSSADTYRSMDRPLLSLAFSASGPTVWNSLPSERLTLDTLQTLLFLNVILRRIFLWPPYGIGQTIIFLPCGFFLLLFFFFYSSLNLSGRRLDVYHTPHMVWPLCEFRNRHLCIIAQLCRAGIFYRIRRNPKLSVFFSGDPSFMSHYYDRPA